MRVDLKRTFSRVNDASDDNDDEDWTRYLGRGGNKLGWQALHEKPVVVIVGEAGIGKTIEFENECDRMRSMGKHSFFIALNQLVDAESWERSLLDQEDEYAKWQKSEDLGYFFLDAVDEARLRGHADFERALVVVRSELSAYLARVRIALSSRWTDWNVEGVKACVGRQLTSPIQKALRSIDVVDDGTEETVAVSDLPTVEMLEPYVVSLDPLSAAEASRYADTLGLNNSGAFWAAVSDGSFEFMATRPLDLGWMVSLWNSKGSLGIYLELIEANMGNRLTEVNPSYETAGAVLSLDQLRSGVEELAAATEFSSCPFVSTHAVVPPSSSEVVAPQAILSGWKPDEISRLLASAVFDEATYGRVKFHHRSSREYLAACWVKRQLANGVPFKRLLRLFAAAPFGAVVLIPTRRASLCWLAAIDVMFREWVCRHFPELLLYEGDPEAWDEISADQAFMAYVERLKGGLRTDWYNDASEFRRVGRRLPPGRVAGLLADKTLPPIAVNSLLPVVKHGRLTECAEVIFGIYGDPTKSPRERRYALEVLEAIALPAQREAVKEDLLAGALKTNELVAAALEVVGWPSLGAEQLASLFLSADDEKLYSNGALTYALRYEMLPEANVEKAKILLEAVLHALPQPEEGKRFARFPESERPKRAWLLDVLPDCFERLLELLPTNLETYPDACIEAAERIEAMRFSGFTERDEFTRLHSLIAAHTNLRWLIARAIGLSEDVTHAENRLTWGLAALVNFTAADLPELTVRANDTALGPEERNIWFTVGMVLAFRKTRGSVRQHVLAALTGEDEQAERAIRVARFREETINGVKRRRQWAADERRREREKLAKHDAERLYLQTEIPNIRNASHRRALQRLLSYSYHRSNEKNLTHVDYPIIGDAFGFDMAAAFADGLKAVWSVATVPVPNDYPNGEIPWDVLLALGGLHTMLNEGGDISALTDPDAVRAAQLAAWELNQPPSWFEDLVHAKEDVVCGALHPWVLSEAVVTADTSRYRGALGLTLNCSPSVRTPLMKPLLPLVVAGRIGHPQVLKAVVEVLLEDGQIASPLAGEIFRKKVAESIGPEGVLGDVQWLYLWLQENNAEAITWFESHLADNPAQGRELLKLFAEAAVDCKWVKLPADDATIDVLLRLHELLPRHLPTSSTSGEDESPSGLGPVSRMRETMLGLLVQARGSAAHRALVHLAYTANDPTVKGWYLSRVQEHARLETLQSANVDPAGLRSLGAPFMMEPRTEGQLFEQVLARLEEIRTRIEEGPFSERDLFSPGMPEKYLQRWLAAHFRDTPNRRFSIHREEEVDDDKKTDIQLSAKIGNVCVEIKPVDGGRYSANSLVGTLSEQIVGQYLKGENSQHGILVLFRLDTKNWDIPDGQKAQPFPELVRYLQGQADRIRSESGIQQLLVFGINCVL